MVTFGEPLWGQVITLRWQILVSRTGDDTLRVLCCVLCVCWCCCVLCVCWCWCWCVTLTPLSFLPHTHPLTVCTFKTPPCAHSKRLRVYTGTTRTCVTTCRRGAGTHGDVLGVHTGHHTARTHHDHNDIHTRHNHHNNTRERKQRKKTEKEDKESRQRKIDRERQDKRR